MLDVAVVGVGKVGATLSAAWHRAGLSVGLVARNLDSSTMFSIAAEFGLPRLYLPEAARSARVVVVADPRESVADLFEDLRGVHASAIFIDAASGPSDGDRFGAMRSLTTGAPVYRAFNTLGWSDFVDPTYGGELPDVFYAGPDDDARDLVEGLVGCLAMRPVYVGGYDNVRLIDSLAELRDAVQAVRPGREVAVRLLERLN